MRPPAIRGALRAFSHARSPSAWPALNAHAKAPRPHTPNASHTKQLSANLCTQACTCFAPHPHDAVCAGNTCRACTRHIMHTCTHSRSSAAPQIQQQQQQPVSITLQRACSMQQLIHLSVQLRSRLLVASVAHQRLLRRSTLSQILQRLLSRQRGSSSQSAALQWQQLSSCQQQRPPHPRLALAHPLASPRCHPRARGLVAHRRSLPFRGIEPQTTAKTCKDAAKTRKHVQRHAKTRKDMQCECKVEP